MYTKQVIPKMNVTALQPPGFFSTFSPSEKESDVLLGLYELTACISGDGFVALEKLGDDRGNEVPSFVSFKPIFGDYTQNVLSFFFAHTQNVLTSILRVEL